ncbi:NADP-dependent oxidoreductase [Nitrospirillum sp. BR 11828]|uniref:NADP-dependent oxidoreductase n=1 Tax=Nitrospirillum sp. BR 11828 TaxID=3104325 RepID=UPI002ACAEC54|nr:NADP-dependent oxidoreductase [Nitrospirillum sp. BR 11828]MDZ5649463.1 NADP-dependent oxidoreductase [Nitrospirillum sp. BR 11828]
MRRLEVVLRRPVGALPIAADFEIRERALPDPEPGAELLVRVLYLSFDPYIGSRLRGRHMGLPAPLPGESLPGECVAEVVRSVHPDFKSGDLVAGEVGWADHGLLPAAQARRLAKVTRPSAHLGVLGMPGLTAWAGVTQLAHVRAGDVFSVNAAAGPVGGTAGQIARLLGARTVGVAGGPEKCALVRDVYGFDACIDYHAPDWVPVYADALGAGSTVHFENVGATQLATALSHIQIGARLVLCGMVEHYHGGPPPQVPIIPIIAKRAHLLGLVVYDFHARLGEWLDVAVPWVEDGRLRVIEDVADGLARAPAQFEALMRGLNRGKSLVRVAPDAP